MADSPTRNPFASSVVLRVPGAQAVDVTRDRPWGGVGRLFDLYRPPGARGPLPAVVFVTGFADPGFRTIAGCAFKDTAPFSSWARLRHAELSRCGPDCRPAAPDDQASYGADPGDSANVTMVSVAITVTYCLPFTA